MNEIHFSTNSVEWSTPEWFFEKLDEEFHFTLDPCATDENHKCEKYYTKEEVDEAIGNIEVDLTGYYTKKEVDDKFLELEIENLLKFFIQRNT